MATEPPQKVWSLDKANVLATSRLWRKVVGEVMKNEFPQLQLGHHLIDSAAMLMVKDPRALNGVIVTSNLFGDIISDEASVIPGSLGLLPSASLNGVPDGKSVVSGIYEPIHGKCCTKTEEWVGLLISLYRLGSRYCRAGEGQSCGNDSIDGYDASILFQSTRRSKVNRGGSPTNDRCQCAHRRHWREIDHQAGWRSCCSRAVENFIWIEAKARMAVHREHRFAVYQNPRCQFGCAVCRPSLASPSELFDNLRRFSWSNGRAMLTFRVEITPFIPAGEVLFRCLIGSRDLASNQALPSPQPRFPQQHSSLSPLRQPLRVSTS